MIVAFRCQPYRLTLTREACGQEYASATALFAKGGTHCQALDSRALCLTCDVGKAHAAGKAHPSAASVTLTRPASAGPIPPTRGKKLTVALNRTYQCTCKICGDAFIAKSPSGRYCSDNCRAMKPAYVRPGKKG